MKDLRRHTKRIFKRYRKTLRTTLLVGIAVITRIKKEEKIRNSKMIEREIEKERGQTIRFFC